jgi:AcrR family transcriptional regulator
LQGHTVKTSPRLSSEERRQAIIKAVRKVFAEKGFHGTTTRELAEAAGVSEALLFKHFPTKEALFLAMHPPCANDGLHLEVKRLMELEPSTSTLVLVVHFLVYRIIMGRPDISADEGCIMHRLMLRSLMEDGDYARLFLQRIASCWTTKMSECFQAARATGDLEPGPLADNLRGWFVHHLAVTVMLYHLPDPPAIDYGMPREKLIEQVVWFALRGIGLKDEAIKAHYNPKALAMFTS